MTSEEAIYLLRIHLGVFDKARSGMILEDGFVTSLRPYTGLHEKNIHEVMEALLTVGEHISRSPQVDRETIRIVWSLCMYPRIWGLRPTGMLQRNKLITSVDIARLETWVDMIEQTSLDLLAGKPLHIVVYHYAAYIVAVGWWENVGYFISLMQRAVADPDIGSAITMILSALSKLGSLSKAVLPTLYELLGRQHSWNNPEFETPVNLDRTTDAVRTSIQQAIDAIERSVGTA